MPVLRLLASLELARAMTPKPRVQSFAEFTTGISPARRPSHEYENQRFCADACWALIRDSVAQRQPPREGTFRRALYDEHLRSFLGQGGQA